MSLVFDVRLKNYLQHRDVQAENYNINMASSGNILIKRPKIGQRDVRFFKDCNASVNGRTSNVIGALYTAKGIIAIALTASE